VPAQERPHQLPLLNVLHINDRIVGTGGHPVGMPASSCSKSNVVHRKEVVFEIVHLLEGRSHHPFVFLGLFRVQLDAAIKVRCRQ